MSGGLGRAADELLRSPTAREAGERQDERRRVPMRARLRRTSVPALRNRHVLRHKAGGMGWGGTEPKQAAYVDDGMLGHPLLDDAWEAAACRCRHQSAPKAAEKRARATWWGGGRTPRTRSCPMTHRQQSPADL